MPDVYNGLKLFIMHEFKEYMRGMQAETAIGPTCGLAVLDILNLNSSIIALCSLLLLSFIQQ